MKRGLLALLIFMLTGVTVIGQPLTGTKSIPGNYPTLKAAIEDLNSRGAGPGGVVFNVSSDLKETFFNPLEGHISTLTGSAASPIIFQKSGAGANPLVTAATGVGVMDAVFSVAGCDYVTFDGITVQENPGNYDQTTMMEWGFAILKDSQNNGSQNITIKNCSVNLDMYHLLSVGIYSNNHTPASLTPLTITSATGTNSNLKIYGNNLSNCYTGISLKGYADAYPYAYYDQNNEVGKDGPNTITNIGSGYLTAYGVNTSYQNNLKVANNTITGNMEGSGNVYGICMTNSLNASFDLYNNTVSIRFTSNDVLNPGYNENFYAIYCDMGEAGTTNLANIYNNLVTNCAYTNPVYGVFYGMYLLNLGVTAQVYGNVVSNNTIGAQSADPSGVIRYFWCSKQSSTPGPLTVYDNIVTGNARIIPQPLSASTTMMGILGNGTTLNAYNNTVSSNVVASSGSTQCLYITFNDQAGKYIYNNSVTNILEANGSVNGLYNANGTYGYFYNNKIQGIHASPSAIYAIISGIDHNSGLHMYYYNNFISDLTNSGSIATAGYSYNMLNGINVEGSVGSGKGFYNNTVYLNAPVTSTAEYGSSAFCAQRLLEVDLRNNIFVNTSASAGANGKTVGIRSRETGFTGFSSNYNDIFCGTPGSTNLIFTDGTNHKATLSEYQGFASPNDLQSISSMPPFLNIASAPFDLHLKPDVATQCESGGIAMSSPLPITLDIDSNTRYPGTGYPENVLYPAMAPDIGADEFAGIPSDISGPQIVYTPLGSINNGNPRTLTATISDANGVPASGFGLPVLYWNKNNQSYIAVQGVYIGNDTYTFTFGGGTVLNDVVSYYVVAQDAMLPIPNVGAFPFQGAAGYMANPPACSTPPATPSTYRVISDISGIKHIGVGKDYATITAAAADLNNKYMSGPVTFILDDNTYPDETFPIRFNERPGNSPENTLTIKPNTGATPVIIGTGFQNGIIVMNGIDYVTFDGSNNGTGSKDLTIENTSSSGNAHAFGITNHGGLDPSTYITLKNCILKGNKASIQMEDCVIAFNHQGGPTGGGYNNCVISNNTIMKAKYGIRVLASPGNVNRDITISGNIISSTDTTNYLMRGGIEVTESVNTLIRGNDILGWADGTGELFEFGIIIYGNCPNTKIHNNKIHNIYSLAWGAYGIKYSNESNNPPSEIFNNVIYDIKCWGANPGAGNNLAYGVFIRRGSNLKIWHNSIYLSGPYLYGNDNWAPSSACIGVYEAATTGLDIRDNILRNSMTNPANPPPGSGNEGRAYGIMFSGSIDDFSTLDYNTYSINGYHGTVAMRWISTGGFGGFFETLDDWHAYTGQDVHSDTLNPVFVSDTTPINLHPTNLNLNNTGGPKIVDTDYNDVPRSTPPDRGAYEWSALITGYHTLPATSVTLNGAVLHGDIDTRGEVVEVFFDYGTTASYGSVVSPTPATVRSVGILLPLNTALTGLLPNTTYHYRFWGIPTTSGQANIYGEDMTFTTSDIPENTVVLNSYSNDTCFNATNTITVAGAPNSFVVTSTGHVTMIAGQRIVYLPGTTVQPGGYLHGYITQTGDYCSATKSFIAADNSTGEETNSTTLSQSLCRVFPNPTTGVFTLEINGADENGQANVEIFSMQGTKISSREVNGNGRHELTLSGSPAGIFLIRVIVGNKTETTRIIKQ